MILVSPTPRRSRDRKWRKYVKGAKWIVEGTTISYKPRRGKGFVVQVGDEQGQAAALVRLSGRLVVEKHARLIDHYILVDCDGSPVSDIAVRRAFPDSDPQKAWWPLENMRSVSTAAGIPMRFDTAHSLADLHERFGDILETDPIYRKG